MTYEQLYTIYANSGQFGHNTAAVSEDDKSISVVYYATKIVTAHPDGTFTLRTGGHRTVTTKERINQWSPAKVYAERKVWYVDNGGNPVPFVEGMRVDSKGRVVR
jgi:hypothetical protein